MSYLSYSNYLKVIEELQDLLINDPFNPEIESYLNVILSILSQRTGPSTLEGLLNYDLKEQLITIYFEHKETIDMIYKYIFIKLHFNNEIARDLKQIFVPKCITDEKERSPTRCEELYMDIISLSREYDTFEINGMKDKNYLNIFPQKLNSIKNKYTNIVRNNLEKLDKFDKCFFEDLIDILNEMNEEIKGKKKQIKKRTKNYKNVNINNVKGIPLKDRTFFYDN